ncbi:MAG: hypothetical protein Kow00114_14460 [Kiloniellaceae bacterium]
MFCRKSQLVPYLAGALIVALLAWGTAVSAGGQAAGNGAAGNGPARYKPVEGIHRDFGMKSITGYFVRRDGRCQVALLVMERSDPAFPALQSATRVRLALAPGDTVALNGDAGGSLNLRCGAQAASLTLDSGGRGPLAKLGGAVIPAAVAEIETAQRRR